VELHGSLRLRRINEGAAMIRSKGEAGTGDVSNATTHMRQIRAELLKLAALPSNLLFRLKTGAFACEPTANL
jgi:pyridoxal biosynthesis lyase PdxS